MLEYFKVITSSAVAGAIIIYIINPFIKLYIDRKNVERLENKQLLKDLRSYLKNNNPKNEDFINSEIYIRIRPQLSSYFIEELETYNTTTLTISSYRNYYQAKFFEELDRIEFNSKKWYVRLFNKRKNKSYKTEGMITVTAGKPLTKKKE